MNMLEEIINLRGGLPEKCDFCQQTYNENRQPIPEEAGEWTCTECWDRWEKESQTKEQT